jgi:galactitol-specific phosphotransferase system IIB component
VTVAYVPIQATSGIYRLLIQNPFPRRVELKSSALKRLCGESHLKISQICASRMRFLVHTVKPMRFTAKQSTTRTALQLEGATSPVVPDCNVIIIHTTRPSQSITMSSHHSRNHDAQNSGLDKSDPFMNIKKNMDEHIHETTRKIGGRGATPAMVAPSMGALPFNDADIKAKCSASMSASMMKTKLTPVSSQTKFVWNVRKAPELPEFHSLERTTVFVPDSTSTMISSRISDLLRERSIQATYDSEKAKVRCMTTDGVDFRIRLYQGRSQYGHGIIVEVQRRFGTSIHFHSDAQAILDAVQGKKPAPSPPRRTVLPEVSDDEFEQDDAPQPTGSSSLVMVEKMLGLPGFDAQFLGLQTLSALVDPDRMSTQTARRTAMALLKLESAVGEKIFGYITNRKTSDESYTLLRVMALGILANAMRACSVVPDFLRGALRPVLLEDLLQAQDNTNSALLAAKCMEYFIRGDYDTMELHDGFEAARKVGEARHVALMEQAERCISSIR